jgi:hypothetical protein
MVFSAEEEDLADGAHGTFNGMASRSAVVATAPAHQCLIDWSVAVHKAASQGSGIPCLPCATNLSTSWAGGDVLLPLLYRHMPHVVGRDRLVQLVRNRKAAKQHADAAFRQPQAGCDGDAVQDDPSHNVHRDTLANPNDALSSSWIGAFDFRLGSAFRLAPSKKDNVTSSNIKAVHEGTSLVRLPSSFSSNCLVTVCLP